jgi:hypothetical protein
VGVIVGLLVYFLPIYAAAPRPSLGGGGDRAPDIVLARYRQAQFDATADDRPPPRPFVSALPPASAHVAFVPELAGAAPGRDGRDLAPLPGSPGSSRSPPVV